MEFILGIIVGIMLASIARNSDTIVNKVKAKVKKSPTGAVIDTETDEEKINKLLFSE